MVRFVGLEFCVPVGCRGDSLEGCWVVDCDLFYA